MPPAQPLSVELLGHVTPDPTGQKPLPLLTLDGKPLDADGDPASTSILRDFTTEPLPIVTSRGVGDRVRNVVDPNFTAQGNSVDVVVAFLGGNQAARGGRHRASSFKPCRMSVAVSAASPALRAAAAIAAAACGWP